MKLLKQAIPLLLMFLLLQVFADGSIVWAQQDSTKQFTLAELKQIAGLLPELQKRRELNVTCNDKEVVYKSIIAGYQNDQELFKQQIANKNAEIEAVTPAWYNNFWTGSAITAIVISSIYFLAR